MNTHADKAQEDKSQSVSNGESQMQSGGESTFQFVDNRPEAVAQRKLQEMVNNSPQVKQLRAFQEMANNSPQAKQAAQLQVMANNYSAQHQQPIQKKGNNTGLPDNLKTGMENLSGMSLDDVKVHRNSDKPAQLQAHAYAQGTDIHIASGQEGHLPHEAWHVVQQKQGRVKPTIQLKGVKINDNSKLEAEATKMGNISLMYKRDVSNESEILKSTPSKSVAQLNRIVSHNAESNTSPVTTIINFIADQTGFSTSVVKSAINFFNKKHLDVLSSTEADSKPVSVKAYINNVTGSKGRETPPLQTAIGKLGYLEDVLRDRESGLEYDGGHLLGYGWYSDWDLINTAKNIAPQNRAENRSIYGFKGGWGETESEFREITKQIPSVVTAYVNYAGGTYTVSLKYLAKCLLDKDSDVYKRIEEMYKDQLRFVVLNSRIPKQYVLEYTSLNPIANDPEVDYENVQGELPTAWVPTRIPRSLLAPIEDAILRQAAPMWESLGSVGKSGGATVSKNHPTYWADSFSELLKLTQFGIYYLVYSQGYSYVAAGSTILYYFGNGTFSSIIQSATINNTNLFSDKMDEFIGMIDSGITTSEKLFSIDKLVDYSKTSVAFLTSKIFKYSGDTYTYLFDDKVKKS
jgi:hypothetical protein